MELDNRYHPTSRSSEWHSCCIFRKWRLLITTIATTCLTEIDCVLPQSLHTNMYISASNWLRNDSCYVISNLLLNNNPNIRRYSCYWKRHQRNWT